MDVLNIYIPFGALVVAIWSSDFSGVVRLSDG